MKSLAKSYTSDYLSLPESRRERSVRAVWTATQASATEQANEAQVVRGLMVAVPLSFALWVPLIWAAAHFF